MGRPALITPITDEVSMVSDLFIMEGVWNVAKVRRCFAATDADLILNIPLNTRSVNDRLCWNLPKMGNFW